MASAVGSATAAADKLHRRRRTSLEVAGEGDDEIVWHVEEDGDEFTHDILLGVFRHGRRRSAGCARGTRRGKQKKPRAQNRPTGRCMREMRFVRPFGR